MVENPVKIKSENTSIIFSKKMNISVPATNFSDVNAIISEKWNDFQYRLSMDAQPTLQLFFSLKYSRE